MSVKNVLVEVNLVYHAALNNSMDVSRETAILLSRCLLNFNGLSSSFAPCHLKR